ncbi:C2H2 type zinc-finger-domain-containing protein [Gongronella butleri]|nr:C2H2 type zinc-finger-domain-containing protein [Gongronella butleri]
MSIAQVLTSALREAQPTPANDLFTCLTCSVAFKTSEAQRTHYRTDWHKYNLKRRMLELSAVSAEQFAQKVLAQQAVGREEEEKANYIYECGVCKRSYANENSFSNHLKSKRHRDLEFKVPKVLQGKKEGEQQQVRADNGAKRQQLFSDDEEASHADEDQPTFGEDHNLVSCIFCHHTSSDFDANLSHMILDHGFFLPDQEYLVDVPGLIAYLAEKVMLDHICIYCNDIDRPWKSLGAVRAHMMDKGHCKMAYDDSEDPEELLQYYDFGPIDMDDLSTAEPVVVNGERLLENGARIGHRQRVRYFKQRLQSYKSKATTQPLSIEDKERHVAEVTAQAEAEGIHLNRKQRRHLLLTDGSIVDKDPKQALMAVQTAQGQQEFARKQYTQQHVELKNNKTTTLRLRNQVPF